MFYWLGQNPWQAHLWANMILEWSDARDLIIAAFVVSALLGWAVHPRLPFRGALLAILLVFAAVWMDFQGYYVVLHEGDPKFLPHYYDNSTTYRLDDLPGNDKGRAFITMTLATIAAWVPLAIWVLVKRQRKKGSRA